MSSVNYGQQKILFKFRTKLDSDYLDRTFKDVLEVGVYSGLTVSIVDDDTIRINPGKFVIGDGTYQCIIMKEAYHDIPVLTSTIFIVARWTYSKDINWYANFLTVSYENIQANDVVIGKAIFTGSTLSSIVYDNQTKPSKFFLESLKDNLKVSETQFGYLSVKVNPGFIILNDGNRYNFTETYLPVATPHTTYNRIDIVVVNEDGDLEVIPGTPAPTPAAPSYATLFGLAEILVKPGVTEIFNEDITDVRSFFTTPFNTGSVLNEISETYYNKNIVENELETLRDKIEKLEFDNTVQELNFRSEVLTLNYKEGLIYDLFNKDVLSKRKVDALDTSCELSNEHTVNLNWKYDEEHGIFKNGFLKPNTEKYFGEIIDEFEFSNVVTDSGVNGYARLSSLNYDSTNECYWCIVNENNGTKTNYLVRLSKDWKDGKPFILGRWKLDLGTYTGNAHFSACVSDGSYLYMLVDNYSTAAGNGWLGKLAINKTGGIFNGTLGANSRRSGETITQSATIVAGMDWRAVKGISGTLKLPALVVWNSSYIGVLIYDAGAAPYDVSIQFTESGDNGAGAFNDGSAISPITGLRRIISQNSANFTNYYNSILGMCKDGNNLYIKYNLTDTQHKQITVLNVADNGASYTGDIAGNIVSGSPRFMKASGLLYLGRYNNEDQTTQSAGAMCISHDGHLLQGHVKNGTNAEFTILKRAINGAYYPENHISGIFPLVNIRALGSYPVTSWSNVLGATRSICIENNSGVKYIWVASFGVTANQVDLFRIRMSDGAYQQCRFTTGEFTGISGIAIDSTNTNIYLCFNTSTASSRIYSGTLSSLLALMTGMGDGYSVAQAVTPGTSWGTSFAGLTGTTFYADITIAEDRSLIYLLNHTNSRVDSITLDGVTLSTNIFPLGTFTGNEQYRGIAYRDGKLFVCLNATADLNKNHVSVYDIDLSTSSKAYRLHIYQDVSSLPLDTGGGSSCLAFDGYELWTMNSIHFKGYKIKTLEDPDVLQLHSFIDEQNALYQSYWVIGHKWGKSYFTPEEYTEELPVDLTDPTSAKVKVPSKRNYMGENWLVVGYKYVDAAKLAGFSILKMDKFLNDKDSVTASGHRRYDVRKIDPVHFTGGGSTLATLNMGGSNSSSAMTAPMFVEKDIIVFANASQNLTNDNELSGVRLLNLKTGKMCLLNSTGFGYYNGTISQRNDGLGYTNQEVSNLQLRSTPQIAWEHIQGIRTFSKNDLSDYNLPYEKTFIGIFEGSTTRTSILEIDWGENEEGIPIRYYRNAINITSFDYIYGSWISEDGYLFAVSASSAGERYLIKSKKKVWEFSNNNDISSLDGGYSYPSGVVNSHNFILYITTPIRSAGDYWDYFNHISSDSFSIKLTDGKWKHYVFLSAYSYTDNLYLICPEDLSSELIHGSNTTGTIYVTKTLRDEDKLIQYAEYENAYLYFFAIMEKKSFNNISRWYNNTYDFGSKASNWAIKYNFMNDNQFRPGDWINRPYFAAGITYGIYQTTFHKMEGNFNSEYNILSVSLRLTSVTANPTQNACALQLLHFGFGKNNSEYESIDVEIDNPDKCYYEKSEIKDVKTELTELASNDTTITYTGTWSLSNGVEELTEANASGAMASWLIPAGYKTAKVELLRNTDLGIAKISLYDVTNSVYVWEDRLVDTYGVAENFFYEIELPELTSSYRVEIEHNANHNSSSSSPYSIEIGSYILLKDTESNFQADLVTWDEEFPATTYSYTDIQRGKNSLIKQQTFSPNGTDTVFTLSGDNRAFELYRISENSGGIWRYPEETNHFTYGLNFPDYNNELIDSNGYTNIKFLTAPTSSTNSVIVQYVPRATKAYIKQTCKFPEGEEIDKRGKPRLLDYLCKFSDRG